MSTHAPVRASGSIRRGEPSSEGRVRSPGSAAGRTGPAGSSPRRPAPGRSTSTIVGVSRSTSTTRAVKRSRILRSEGLPVAAPRVGRERRRESVVLEERRDRAVTELRGRHGLDDVAVVRGVVVAEEGDELPPARVAGEERPLVRGGRGIQAPGAPLPAHGAVGREEAAALVQREGLRELLRVRDVRGGSRRHQARPGRQLQDFSAAGPAETHRRELAELVGDGLGRLQPLDEGNALLQGLDRLPRGSVGRPGTPRERGGRRSRRRPTPGRGVRGRVSLRRRAPARAPSAPRRRGAEGGPGFRAPPRRRSPGSLPPRGLRSAFRSARASFRPGSGSRRGAPWRCRSRSSPLR